MDSASRYEVFDTIATGDFATVYRARDRDLGREVAVKQIHQHFLTNEQQLANYWREAQLLAQLQHPNVLTIYDIVRPRGWLIVELMQGNLAPGPDGDPIDLDYLRAVLAGSLNALHFLHSNGVVHGDIKPSNMLVDKQRRVKLGDFGLARRASSDEGSLLKGTTKYMAPELVSNAFGAVGPASDLYSLGFTAYELMCGGQFETLFPGLDSYGRDKQIAWMMWHAAPDRKLPAVARVLEGVPEDLATVIQRLTAKEQSQRYQSADQVLRDLRHDPLQIPVTDQAEDEVDPAALAEAKKKKQTRLVAIAMLCVSMMMCIAMLLPPKKEVVAPPPKDTTVHGIVSVLYPDEMRFRLEREDDDPQSIKVNPRDSITINGKKSLLEDLRVRDNVSIKTTGNVKTIIASRPDLHEGRIVEVTPDAGTFKFAYTPENEKEETELTVRVPEDLTIAFNKKETFNGAKMTVADLVPGDEVEVHHMGEIVEGVSGRYATEMSILRVLDVSGIIREIDPTQTDRKGPELTMSVGETPDGDLLALPVDEDCEITLNDRKSLGTELLKLTDLKPGDKATIAHDTRIVRINAYRVLGDHGIVQDVQSGTEQISVLLDNTTQPKNYIVRAPCEITLGGEAAKLTDLRPGDEVDITHDMPGAASPVAITVAARREADLTRWAILVGNQKFGDSSVSPLATPLSDVALFRSALIKRYQMLPAQVHVLTDESLVRLQQGISGYLRVLKPTDSVILYISGHAYKDDSGQVYIAPKDFNFRQMGTTGLPLQWLVDQFEACPSTGKLMLLDCSHVGTGADLARQPSTAEMVGTLKAPPNRGPLRTFTAIASCSAGQKGLVLSDNKTSLFPWLLTHAYSGAADKNRDNRLEPTELFSYLSGAMPQSARKLGGAQAPQLFLPDDRPPRLTEDAKKAIRHLAGLLRQDNINVADAEALYTTATQAAGGEVEPRLLYGLLLLKAKERDAAQKHFEDLKVEFPDLILPLQAISWLRHEKRGHKAGTDEMYELIITIPPAQKYSRDVLAAIYWVGQLRDFVANCPQQGYRPTPQTLTRLDQAIAARGPAAEQAYTQGRQATMKVLNDFKKKAAGGSAADVAKTKIEVRRLSHYVDFPYDMKAQEVLSGLDK